MPSVRILEGDAAAVLRTLPPQSVQCVVTSPPYWGQRLYQAGEAEIGGEPTLDEYVAALVTVFREVRRVLKNDGVLFLNLGDKYAFSGGPGGDYNKGGLRDGQPKAAPIKWRTNQGGSYASERPGWNGASSAKPGVAGLKPKDLIGLPWMVAFALRADGWYLRSEIIWHKPNPMPQSVMDRPSTSHETVFLLSKSQRYFYNAEAVRTPSQDWGQRDRTTSKYHKPGIGPFPPHKGLTGQKRLTDSVETANLKSVWRIPTQPFSQNGDHYATFPVELPRLCILAGSNGGDTVLDPFSGAGTTGLAANQLGRDYIGIELKPEYAAMSRRRIFDDAPLFAAMEGASA